MFYGCKSLQQITIPSSVVYFRVGTFANSGLTRITIPESVTQIADDAFANCSSLTLIDVCGSGISYCGENAFGQTPSSVSVTESYLGEDACNVAITRDAVGCGESGDSEKPPEIVEATKEKEEKKEISGPTVVIATGVDAWQVGEMSLTAGASLVVVGNVVLDSSLSFEEGTSLTADQVVLADDNKVEISMKASGIKLPKLNLGEVPNTNTPSKIDIKVDGQDMTPEEFDWLASGKVVILTGSGPHFDCDKWNSRIKLDIAGDSKYDWSTRCRAQGSDGASGRLLSDETKEIYVIGEEDTGLSPGAIVGIVIGCLAGVALIAGCVFFYIKKRSFREPSEEEP